MIKSLDEFRLYLEYSEDVGMLTRLKAFRLKKRKKGGK